MITVIIPVLNAMPYLTEALASLEAQTFRNFDVCLWDNGSTDGSVEEATRWIPSRLRGRVISGNPLPLHECLARMVEEARTEFVARMDGDDVCLPERFALQIDYLKNNPLTALVSGQKITTDASGISLGLSEKFPTKFGDILFGFLFQNTILHPGVLMRKDAVLSVGNYSAPKPVEDFDLWLRIALKYEIANLEQVVLRYRRHESAVCGLMGQAPESISTGMLCVAQKYSQKLWNISPETYSALNNKKHPCSCLPLLNAMNVISARTGESLVSTLSSPWKLSIARCLTGSNDFISKATWRFVEYRIPRTSHTNEG
jgi:glycosyltransferase involved in cell wall biosynthesis